MVKERLGTPPDDPAVRDLDRLRAKPGLSEVVETVLHEFGEDAGWAVGCRADDASRAIAAYLARRRYGYSAKSVANALGYLHPSSVSHAIRRIDVGSATLRQTVNRLERRLQRR